MSRTVTQRWWLAQKCRGGAVCDFDFLSVPVIMGRKPAHMQFAHQPLIVSDCCHGHSKTIRCERWKLITKAYTIQNKHCLHTNFKCGLHCHQNTHCSLWEEYSWRHNYNIWCCINKISKKHTPHLNREPFKSINNGSLHWEKGKTSFLQMTYLST